MVCDRCFVLGSGRMGGITVHPTGLWRGTVYRCRRESIEPTKDHTAWLRQTMQPNPGIKA